MSIYVLDFLIVISLLSGVFMLIWGLRPQWLRVVKDFFFKEDPSAAIIRDSYYKDSVLERATLELRHDLEALEEIQELEALFAMSAPIVRPDRKKESN